MSKEVLIAVEINETTVKVLQNAVAALGDIYYALSLNCEVPTKFKPFEEKSNEELQEEFSELVKFFKEVEREWEICRCG